MKPPRFKEQITGRYPCRAEASERRRIGLGAQDAVKYIRKEDRGSRRYAQAYFHTSINDDLLYHLVINTDRIPYQDAAMLIASEAQEFPP